ncbi:MAG: hypothetical protein IJR82_01215 [Bacilli bacterium]|nr:hypothetical protein [Bacilli bacterium]
MKESFWGAMAVILGVTAIGLIYFFQNVTNTDEHNYNLLKETTEAAMYDAFDLSAYRDDGSIRIIQEKFIENFLRRFAENASLSHNYQIDIYDINEFPPKVSIKLSTADNTTRTNVGGRIVQFNIVNKIDAILETRY